MKFRVEKVSEAMGGGFSFHSDLFLFLFFFPFHERIATLEK